MSEVVDRVEFVKALYLDLLGREADSGGLEHYVSSSMTEEQMKHAFMCSSEYAVKMKAESGRIEMVSSFVGVAPTPSEEYYAQILELGFKCLITLGKGPPSISEKVGNLTDESSHGFDARVHFEAPSDGPMSVKNIVLAVSVLKQMDKHSQKTNSKVLVCCPTSTLQSSALIWMWLVNSGLDEQAALLFTKSRIEGSTPEDLKMGPWHIEAAQTLEMF